jgi:hypothetical protein
MRLTPDQIDTIQSTVHAVLCSTSGLAFAVLVGCRAEGASSQDSDWDISIQWSTRMLPMDKLGATEELRQSLCRTLQVADSQIDLIDLADARLTMRALVAEEGVPLWIGDDLAWVRFLQNTWAQLEDNQWRKQHAA